MTDPRITAIESEALAAGWTHEQIQRLNGYYMPYGAKESLLFKPLVYWQNQSWLNKNDFTRDAQLILEKCFTMTVFRNLGKGR